MAVVDVYSGSANHIVGESTGYQQNSAQKCGNVQRVQGTGDMYGESRVQGQVWRVQGTGEKYGEYRGEVWRVQVRWDNTEVPDTGCWVRTESVDL